MSKLTYKAEPFFFIDLVVNYTPQYTLFKRFFSLVRCRTRLSILSKFKYRKVFPFCIHRCLWHSISVFFQNSFVETFKSVILIRRRYLFLFKNSFFKYRDLGTWKFVKAISLRWYPSCLVYWRAWNLFLSEHFFSSNCQFLFTRSKPLKLTRRPNSPIYYFWVFTWVYRALSSFQYLTNIWSHIVFNWFNNGRFFDVVFVICFRDS